MAKGTVAVVATEVITTWLTTLISRIARRAQVTPAVIIMGP
jgi:hypothetical protein